jgi:hypothetical membrane protein
VLTFGSYLIPLALLEIYFAASRTTNPVAKVFVALLIVAAAAYTAIGVFGTVAFMWAPYLTG